METLEQQIKSIRKEKARELSILLSVQREAQERDSKYVTKSSLHCNYLGVMVQ